MASLNFNAEEVEPSAGDFPVWPAGWYKVMITESEMKETNAKTGHYLEMRAKNLEGDFINQMQFIRLNIDNPNPVAVKIAQEQLSAICHAVGVTQISDSTQLHGSPFEIKVKVKPADEDYEESNEVKGFRAIEGSGAPVNSANGGADPAWANKDKPAAKTKPAAKAKPAPKEVKPVLEMIDTEYTYEEWKETGRSDEEMVEEGIAKWAEVKKAPQKKSPPQKKPTEKDAYTAGNQNASAESADEDGENPPWMQ